MVIVEIIMLIMEITGVHADNTGKSGGNCKVWR